MTATGVESDPAFVSNLGSESRWYTAKPAHPVVATDYAHVHKMFGAWPDDTYGLVVHGLGDLGDADLAPLQMAWGLAKAKVLRARRTS